MSKVNFEEPSQLNEAFEVEIEVRYIPNEEVEELNVNVSYKSDYFFI